MFDLLFGTIDSLIAFLPLWLRVTLWGLVMGGGSMLMYGWLSPQDEISELKDEVEEARQKMQSYEGDEFEPVLEMAKESISLSLKQMRVMLGSTMAAGLPILAVLVWMEGAYTHTFPDPGQTVQATVRPADALEGDQPEAAWKPTSAVAEADDKGVELTWPADDGSVQLVATASGEPLVTLPTEAPRAHVPQKSWTHWFFANPAGYLPADGPVDRVTLHLPTRRALPFGPAWLHTWHFLFLVVLSVAAMVVKVAFDID